MQRVFVVFNYYNYFNYACFFVFCVLCCVCLCFVWFVLIHSIITRIKSKATKVELYVECFVLISLSIYSSVVLHSSICCVSTRNRIRIPSFNRGLFCVLAIKTVTLFNYNFLGKKILSIFRLCFTHLLFVVV